MPIEGPRREPVLVDQDGDENALGERYSDGSYLAANPDWHADDAPWKAKQIERILARNHVVPTDFCEIGCGSGACTELVKAAYPASRGTGFEISPQAFDLCSARASAGLEFYNESPFDGDRRFDMAIVLDVIEHLDDPFAFVRSVSKLSQRQVFHIPLDMNVLAVGRDWPIMEARSTVGHLNYYSRSTAVALLRDCGLTVVDELYTPWAIDQSYKTWKKRVAALPRRLAFAASPHAAVRIMGGWSLMVLTTSDGTRRD